MFFLFLFFERSPLRSWRAFRLWPEKNVRGIKPSCSLFLSLARSPLSLFLSLCPSLPFRERGSGQTSKHVDDPYCSGRGVSGAKAATARAQRQDVAALGLEARSPTTTSSIGKQQQQQQRLECRFFFSPGSSKPSHWTDLFFEQGRRLAASVDAPSLAQPGEREAQLPCSRCYT